MNLVREYNIPTSVRYRKVKIYADLAGNCKNQRIKSLWDNKVEQPLEKFELCQLASINLENLYNPETNDVDWNLFKYVIQMSIRFLDDIIDINNYALPEFEEKAKAHRKIGLGVTGFANLLIKMGIRYDSDECLDFIKKLFGFKRHTENEYNSELALEKGNFPAWNESIYASMNIPARCATISTQAPAGSVSTILGTTAYGIEPLFMVAYQRNIVTGSIIEVNQLFADMLHDIVNDSAKEKDIIDSCLKAGTTQIPEVPQVLRNLFRCANDIDPIWHIKVQAEMQKYYQNAISKTINAPEHATKDELADLLIYAWRNGCKGLTYYRNNSRQHQTIQIGQKDGNEKEQRGYVKPAADIAKSIRYKLTTGCGTLYCNVSFDDDGNITETFIESANGGCQVFTKATSRLISLALRGGIPLEKVVDQLVSAGACPAYQFAKGKGEPVSPGKSCASAIANVLKNLPQQKEQSKNTVSNTLKPAGSKCPECGATLIHESGCVQCPDCGWSRCD